MWVRFLAGTRWKPTNQVVIRYSAGQVINLPADAARALISAGKAAAAQKRKNVNIADADGLCNNGDAGGGA